MNIQKRDVASVNSSTCSRCASAEQQRYDGSDSSSASLSLSLSLSLALSVCVCVCPCPSVCVRVRWFNAVHSRTRQTLRRQCTFTPHHVPPPSSHSHSNKTTSLASSLYPSSHRLEELRTGTQNKRLDFRGHPSRNWGFCISFRFLCSYEKPKLPIDALCRNKIAATSSDIPGYGGHLKLSNFVGLSNELYRGGRSSWFLEWLNS